MTYEVQIEGQTRSVTIERVDGGWKVAVDDGAPQVVTGKQVGRAEWILDVLGRGRTVGVHVGGDHASLQVDGHAVRAVVTDPRRQAFDGTGGAAQGLVATPMPGVVARVLVSEGQQVTADQVLVVVEAMKMENEFRAPVDGTVTAVHVEAGQALEANAPLVTVEPA